MPPVEDTTAVCPDCGTRTEKAYSSNLDRCMICLLRAGFAEASEEVRSPMTDRFGPYIIDHREDGKPWELGHGAMGVTYRAVDSSLQRPVALKLINTDVANSEARERFIREARLAASLRHPSVATVHHFGIQEETGQCFYAMELLEGETLDERVRRTGPLDVRSVVAIARQITAALVEAEKRGLVHRDLKPANIMVLAADTNETKPEAITVKVIDFGIAKALTETPDARVLTHGGFIGTPAFASPEQLGGNPVDVRSDIYSLGATLWYLLTGHMPFGDHQSGSDHVKAKPDLALVRPPVQQLKAARVPSALISLLLMMLETEPAARPNVRELANRLEKIQLTDRGKTLRRYVLLGGLLASAAAVALSFFYLSGKQQSEPRPLENSVAVLPFENLSEEKTNAFFTDGVQDQILTNLAKIADLKVISRTSVMQYKSGDARNLREIGQQLGVAHLLEGTVQRAGNKVRVTAQLINAQTDAHEWAENYDRPVDDVFAIQSEIAKAIADQLRAKLSPSEKSAIDQPPTSDIAAFDLYSRAKNLILATNFSGTTGPNLRQAVDLLNQALARDPTFFLVQCQLASAHDRLYFLGIDHTPARLALAEAALTAAFRLRPDAGEAHLARAQNLYWGYLDYDGAMAELEIARQTLPNDPRIFELIGYIARRRGQQEEALRHLERAGELDPRNFFTLQQIASSYLSLRRYPEEAAILDRALSIQPDDVDTKVFRASIAFDWKGDTRPLHQTLDEIRAKDAEAIKDVADTWLICALAERDADIAQNALVALGENFFGYDAVRLYRDFGEGLFARMTKDEAKARSAFTAARTEQERRVQAQPGFGPALCVLGLIDAGLGRKEEALREGRRAIELLPVEKDAINGALIVEYFAITAAWVGEKDLACEQLAKAVQLNGSGETSYGRLKLLPYWDPLRGDPRFEKIVASLAPK